MLALIKFFPAICAFLISLVNALEPAIAQFVANHPDIAVNGYGLLTTIANAINPRNKPTPPMIDSNS